MGASSQRIAVTGATGFVGRHVVAALAAAGWQVRVLARSEPAHALWRDAQPEVVLGSLSDAPALARLVAGCDAVLHLAGAIKARDTASFMRVNRDGTAALAAAIQQSAPEAHLLHLSSLAAREPALSGYCASKRAGEEAVLAAIDRRRLSILRPPAVYGPGDRETLVFFQLAQPRWVLLPQLPQARLALIHVHDLASAILQRLEAGPSGMIQTVADGQPEGYRWEEILSAAAAAVGNRQARFVPLPRALIQGIGQPVGWVAQWSGQAAMFNAGKLRELLHGDWSAPRESLFTPERPAQHGLQSGFAATAEWYFHAAWLRRAH